MATKLTNEDVDKRLEGRTIRRLENYKGAVIKIKWRCLKKDCNYEWLAKPNDIFSGKGCPKCAGTIKLTNTDVDIRIIGNNIIRLGDINGIHNKILWKCIKNNCGYEWLSRPHDIFAGYGCPKCANSLPITNDEADKRIENRDIKRIGNVCGSNNKILWECLKKNCGYKWLTTPSTIFSGNGCPKCAKSIPITNQEADKRLVGKNIKRLEDINGVTKKYRWKCLKEKCGFEWETSASNILNNKTGCPRCSSHKTEKSIYNYLKTLINENDIHYNKKRIYYNDKKYFIIDFFISFNLIIEYNGIQHYKPVRFGGISKEIAEKNFITQQNRDNTLRQYCLQNNLKLLEIPYIMNEKEWKQTIYDFLLTNLSEKSLSVLSFSRLETINAPIAPPML